MDCTAWRVLTRGSQPQSHTSRVLGEEHRCPLAKARRWAAPPAPACPDPSPYSGLQTPDVDQPSKSLHFKQQVTQCWSQASSLPTTPLHEQRSPQPTLLPCPPTNPTAQLQTSVPGDAGAQCTASQGQGVCPAWWEVPPPRQVAGSSSPCTPSPTPRPPGSHGTGDSDRVSPRG